ncbi:hypothetical protein EPN90_02345 [Patescibacteria group bacterium]|nr:MAG: hypothetical protein EPN90_02345 [Patescibacteria group bacterium]
MGAFVLYFTGKETESGERRSAVGDPCREDAELAIYLLLSCDHGMITDAAAARAINRMNVRACESRRTHGTIML